MSIGISEIILILIAVLILFDKKRMPEVIKMFMKAKNEFNKAKFAIKKEINDFTLEYREKPVEFQLKDNNEPPV